jgi:hypothetical protein
MTTLVKISEEAASISDRAKAIRMNTVKGATPVKGILATEDMPGDMPKLNEAVASGCSQRDLTMLSFDAFFFCEMIGVGTGQPQDDIFGLTR